MAVGLGSDGGTMYTVPSIRPVTPLTRPPAVTIEVPGSKSHTNRALLCAALADGRSTLSGVLFADDTEAMLGALATLGAGITADPATASVVVEGGPGRLARDHGSPAADAPAPAARSIDAHAPVARSIDAPAPAARSIDVRQSGTTGRFLLPVLAATPGRHLLDGDAQLQARPFGPQLTALRALGATIEGEALPLRITGRRLAGATVEVASSISSQFLSGLLLAAPLFAGRLTVAVGGGLVSRPYVDLTTATMAAFGVAVGESTEGDRTTFTVDAEGYRPTALRVEPDASAASYFFAAAAITGGRVRVAGLGPGTVQGDLRFVDLLARMGATVRTGPDWTEVEGTGTLRGITADMADISDTAQTLAVVAAHADGPTELTGIGFIRHKETDRIGAVVTELQRRGIAASETPDGLVVRPGPPSPGVVETHGDHRMAMSFALLGLTHPGIEIADPGCVAKTFPHYFDVLDRLRR